MLMHDLFVGCLESQLSCLFYLSHEAVKSVDLLWLLQMTCLIFNNFDNMIDVRCITNTGLCCKSDMLLICTNWDLLLFECRDYESLSKENVFENNKLVSMCKLRMRCTCTDTINHSYGDGGTRWMDEMMDGWKSNALTIEPRLLLSSLLLS